MIHVTANTPNDAWRATFTSLCDDGAETGNKKYFRDEVVLIEIENPVVEPAYRCKYYIAKRIGVPVGKYYHFLDSGHLHNKDLEAIETLRKELAVYYNYLA